MLNVPLQITLITACFAAIYPLVRFLPDTKCEFLHYDHVEGSDDTELCLDDEGSAIFYDMEALQFPVQLSITDGPELRQAAPATVNLHFQTEIGRPINYSELAIVHTERLHLFVIDESLEDYHHVHPIAADGPGNYTFSFTPRNAGTYTLYAEAVPLASKSVVIARDQLQVNPAATANLASSLQMAQLPQGVEFELEVLGGPVTSGYPNDIVIRVRSPQGQPVPFMETMGALCHLAAFDEQGKGFAHLHPLDEGVGVGTEETSFSFVFNTTQPGPYKLWAQFMVHGQDLFVPFELSVQ